MVHLDWALCMVLLVQKTLSPTKFQLLAIASIILVLSQRDWCGALYLLTDRKLLLRCRQIFQILPLGYSVAVLC